MKTPQLPQKEILIAVRDRLLPWVRSGEARLLLAQPPFDEIQGMVVRPQRGQLLEVSRRYRHTSRFLAHWPRHNLIATRTLYVGCVTEGEADLRVGATTDMARKNPAMWQGVVYATLQIPARTVFFIPPGVPFSDGMQPHWERPDLEKAHSRIFWMHFLAEGGLIHTCTTQGVCHRSTPMIFVRDARLALLGELICEALTTQSSEMSLSLLRTLLLRMEQDLAVERDLTIETNDGFTGDGMRAAHTNDFDTAIVQRACRYIQSHLSEPLSLERIAAHVCISVRQLNRLFQNEMKSSVMKYVAAQRVEAAKSLLTGTNLPVQEISDCLGYSHPSYFCSIFLEAMGVTPTQFRQQRFKAKVETLSTPRNERPSQSQRNAAVKRGRKIE